MQHRTLRPVVVVTTHKAVPSIEYSSVKGNFEREKDVEATMLDLLEPFMEGFEENDASSSTPNARSDAEHATREKPFDDKLTKKRESCKGGEGRERVNITCKF